MPKGDTLPESSGSMRKMDWSSACATKVAAPGTKRQSVAVTGPWMPWTAHGADDGLSTS
ncbi:hypothetical protein AHiyo1_06760 [Arthrobacter sp. Hiyo1]|nr:hypothetical protein AHiyo1_06760 [Arthrobacter sp. Hiyo1]